MEIKKSPKADLEGKKTTWLLAGYVMVMAVMYLGFEWTQRDVKIDTSNQVVETVFEEEIEIPQFTEELKQTLLQNASLDFDWSEISPTIFGAVFESTLNPETRRSGGMHYTSIENIHKVIDPLFLNDLRRELDDILEEKVERQRQKKLDEYQNKLASLTFLDPACGSGNFLTETYLSLRRLENEVIRERYHGQTMMGAFVNPIKVSIQ